MTMHAFHPIWPRETRARQKHRASPAPACAVGMLSPGRPGADELAALVGAVCRGDRTAFAALFRALAPRVKGFLMRSGAGSTAAEDLAQETLVLVWRKASSYDHSRASVTTWVFTIARNLWIDQVRRSSNPTGREPQEGWLGDLPDPASAQDASGPLVGEQRRERVRAVLAGLPREQAEAVHMAYFGDATHEQIAARLAIPLGTVKSRIRLAIAALRQRLDGIEL